MVEGRGFRRGDVKRAKLRSVLTRPGTVASLLCVDGPVGLKETCEAGDIVIPTLEVRRLGLRV